MSDETTQNEPENEPGRLDGQDVEGAENAPLTPREMTEHHVGALREWLESPLEYPRESGPWAERADDFMSRNFSDDAASPLDFPRSEPTDEAFQGSSAAPTANEPTCRYDGETGALLTDDVSDTPAPAEHPKRRVEDFQNWFDEPGSPSQDEDLPPVQAAAEPDTWYAPDVAADAQPNAEPSEAEDLPIYPGGDALPQSGVYEPEAQLNWGEEENPSIDAAPQGVDTAASADETPFGFVNDAPFEPPFVPVAYVPEAPDETVRRSGLAWSSGIAFFGSVAFMLFLGWLADLLLGTNPWGIVGGIVLGSVIGFIQFFRISSRIFKNGEPVREYRPILSDSDPE